MDFAKDEKTFTSNCMARGMSGRERWGSLISRRKIRGGRSKRRHSRIRLFSNQPKCSDGRDAVATAQSLGRGLFWRVLLNSPLGRGNWQSASSFLYFHGKRPACASIPEALEKYFRTAKFQRFTEKVSVTR